MIEISGFAEAREKDYYLSTLWKLVTCCVAAPPPPRYPLVAAGTPLPPEPGRTTALDDRNSEWVPTLAQSSNPFPKSLQWRHLSDIFW